jgi:hypothetical protein
VVSRQQLLQQAADNIPHLSYGSGALHANKVNMALDACTVLQVQRPEVRLCVGDRGTFEDLVSHPQIEAKPSMPKVLKKFNILVFGSSSENVVGFFGELVAAIDLKPTDCINVYQVANRDFVVVWYKEDQRMVAFPPHFVFKNRYVFGSANHTTFWDRISTLVHHMCRSVSFDCVEMLSTKETEMGCASDLVLAAKSMPMGQLLLERLTATMVPHGDRTPWQNALVASAGWQSLVELTRVDEKMELQNILWYADAAVKDVPRLLVAVSVILYFVVIVIICGCYMFFFEPSSKVLAAMMVSTRWSSSASISSGHTTTQYLVRMCRQL